MSETLLSAFTMGMLGDFDRDVFTSDFAIVLLVVFIFGVVIIMLNVRVFRLFCWRYYVREHGSLILPPQVFIAVVGDSYADAKRTADRVFLRSRVELAAEYELSMGTFERTLAGLNVFSNLPFMMFSYPLYQLIKQYKDEETADDWMHSEVFLGSLAGWGKDWKTDVLPFQFIYGPLYFLVRLTLGRAAAVRVLPDEFLKFEVPKVEDDDAEKRMKAIEQQNENILRILRKQFPDAERELVAEDERGDQEGPGGEDGVKAEREQLSDAERELVAEDERCDQPEDEGNAGTGRRASFFEVF